MAQARQSLWQIRALAESGTLHATRTLPNADPMHMRQRFSSMELGKPDAGKPPVRFDEGWEADGHWPRPLNPSLPAYSTEIRVQPRSRVEVVRTVLCAVREPHRDCADHSRAFTLKTLPIIPEIRRQLRSRSPPGRTRPHPRPHQIRAF